jgi:hypothetical protein
LLQSFHIGIAQVGINYLPYLLVPASLRNFPILLLASQISRSLCGLPTHLLLHPSSLTSLLLLFQVDHHHLQVFTTDAHPQACTNLAKMVPGTPSRDVQVMICTPLGLLRPLLDRAHKYLSTRLPLTSPSNRRTQRSLSRVKRRRKQRRKMRNAFSNGEWSLKS